MQIIPFIVLALILYFGLHWILYLLALKTLVLVSAQWRLAAGILIGAMSLWLVLSMIFARESDALFARIFYYIGACWFGVLVAGMLVLGIGLFFQTALMYIGSNPGATTWRFILIPALTAYIIYGFANAQSIMTKKFDIAIDNLPADWENKKVVQISDVHLGVINRSDLMDRIVDLALNEKPDFVFITGDLLDGTGDGLHESVAPLNRLNVPIFFVTGNHETYLGQDKTEAAIKDTKIRWLRDEIIEIDGVQIAGADYPDRMRKKDLSPLLEKLDKDKPTILLYHEPASIDRIKSFGIDLQLCGHTHNGQILPAKLFTYLIYRGYDYGLHRSGDFYQYTTSGAGTWGPPMRIGSTAEIAVFKLVKK
jgi:uncharacterized protein